MKIGRNAPCPCGSGKKYKHCCLKLDSANRDSASQVPIRKIAARTEIWQADILPFAATFDDDPGARPATVLITADGFVIFNDILARPSAEVDGIAAELERGVLEAASRIGSLPSVIEVREPEVATVLAGRMRDTGTPTTVRAAPLPGVEAAMVSLNRSMGGPATVFAATRPSLWVGWGQPEAWIAEVFQASAAYYRASPWRHFDDFPPVLAATPAGKLWYLSIMGSGEIEYGLAFYSDPDDLDRFLDDPQSSPNGRILGLTFDSGQQIPRPMRKEIARAGWEVASADAYPVLVALGTPAGGLRRTDALDLVAVTAAVAAWTEAIDRDHRIADAGPWRDPATGVELEVQGLKTFEEPEWPVIKLEAGDAEGPGARPDAVLDSRQPEPRGPRPIDSDLLDRFTAELASAGLSDKTVIAHTRNVELFLEYLTNWAVVPVVSVHEFDLRSFLFDWYPRKVHAGKTEAGRLPASLRRFFTFLDRHAGISCPWAHKLLKDKKSFMAQWEASPDGAWWDDNIIDWRQDHFAELDRHVLSPSMEVPGVLSWAPAMGFEEATLSGELQRRWLIWRDEIIRAGLEQSDDVREMLEQREAEWLTTPHPHYGGRTPVQAIEAERAEAARRRKA